MCDTSCGITEIRNLVDKMVQILDPSQVVTTGNQWFIEKPVLADNFNAHLLVTGIFFFCALLGLIYSLKLAKRERNPYPLYVFFGVGLACFFEPLGDLMIHVTYREPNQINLWSAFGYNVALWVFPCYLFIGGWPANWMLQRIRQGITMNDWMKVFFIQVALMYVFEIPGLHLFGEWMYYGVQPFMILGYPMPMAFTNAAGFIFVTAALSHLLMKHEFIQKHPVLLMPSMAIIFPCSAATTIYPWGFAINATTDQTLVNIGGLGSIVLSICLVWFFGKLVCVPNTEAAMARQSSVGLRRASR